MRDVGAASAGVTLLFAAQAAAGMAVAALRPDLGGATLRHAAVASALLATLGLFARSRLRDEPAVAAGIVAAMFAVEAAGIAALVGIPALPVLLQVSMAALVYGSLVLLAVAAACAACSLRAHPCRRARTTARRSGLDRAA